MPYTKDELQEAVKKWCKNIDREIAQQILVDGGHISRNPATLLMFLRHLIDIRSALKNSNEDISEIIQHTIDKISPLEHKLRSLIYYNLISLPLA